MSDDLHTPTTAAPTPDDPAAGAVSASTPTMATTPETPIAPDARVGLEGEGPAAADRSTTDKIREKVPEPVTQAAQTAAAKAVSVRDSVLGGASSANQTPADRPEILAGAAFAGGFVVAMILKRLGR